MDLPSTHLQKALDAFASLPGIGKKTALRLTLHLLKQEHQEVESFCNAIDTMKNKITTCSVCHNVADDDLCQICMNPQRNKRSLCVVEHLRDLIAIESTQQFNGVYHLLGGLISPLSGTGPEQLHIEDLIKRTTEQEVEEIVFALSPNIQGDTTVYYIQKQLGNQTNIKLSTIARGVAFGGELEYADELTLSRSLTNRLPITSYIEE